MFKKFQRIQGLDSGLANVQANLHVAIDPVLSNPVLDGRVLSFAFTSGSVQAVPHGLGRTFQGWLLLGGVYPFGAMVVQATGNLAPERQLLLRANFTGTGSLYCY